MLNVKVKGGSESDIYSDIMTLLWDLKLTDGGDAVRGTLVRHKKVKDFLRKYQRDELDHLENLLDN